MGLDILHQSLADFGNHRVLSQTHSGDKAIVRNNRHWHCRINNGFFFILFFRCWHVHDDQRLVFLRLDTRTLLLVQCGAHKVLFQSQNIDQITDFLLGRTDRAHPAAVLDNRNGSNTVINRFIKIEHGRLPPNFRTERS